MYTIGQVAEITGISRDRLRYYEEKGILKPKYDTSNNYREYGWWDLDIVLTIEVYRSMNLSTKSINSICENSSVKSIKKLMEKKYEEVASDITKLQKIQEKVRTIIKQCANIEENLNCFSIRSMPRFKVIGEMSDYRAYSEYKNIHDMKQELEGQPIISSIKRMITFSDAGIEENKMVIVRHAEDIKEDDDVVMYDKCVYTVVQDGIRATDVMEETFTKSLKWCAENGFNHKGIVFINFILISFNEGDTRSYLELYAPIE
ncbi:MerR family transcriptional regulator (plasmid) [Clostridium estertheticum]|uniref:MerR family transcriptional regulator n=1 Tax=Clostridium estertheticum TaxID=238834 RepID=UPI001C0DD948|nr:MerR family transcriptional regulator [Clostridium estertheticum]MBU3218264.1 MerR family transcriptional regulator [Clostridium estertheticum]WAG58224.1 MerR family transcriptional regulator [Clostridium estertheticum]